MTRSPSRRTTVEAFSRNRDPSCDSPLDLLPPTSERAAKPRNLNSRQSLPATPEVRSLQTAVLAVPSLARPQAERD